MKTQFSIKFVNNRGQKMTASVKAINAQAAYDRLMQVTRTNGGSVVIRNLQSNLTSVFVAGQLFMTIE